MDFLRFGMLLFSAVLGAAGSTGDKAPLDAGSVQRVVTQLVQREDQATMSGNRASLKAVFLPGSKTAEAVHEKAVSRLMYLNDWAKARQIHFDGVLVHVRTGPARWLGSDEVRVYGADQAQYRYHHLVGNKRENRFGIGVYHWYVLEESHGQWYIKNDTFIDPLNQDTRLKGAAVPAVIQVKPEHRSPVPPSEGAKRAIRYAETYCGAAFGCGNQNRYHSQYADYNWNGGDCTNFISQVLHAGGFSENSHWDGSDGGTPAWVNATRLAQYLRRSGRATAYAEGTLPTLIEDDPSGHSPLDQLRLGDLIGYFETGRVVHFAIVVGFDADGYPLVISHSADRYRVPWDLGWDRTTRFLFYHVHYPS